MLIYKYHFKDKKNSFKSLSSRQNIIDSIISQFDPYRKNGIRLEQIEALSSLPLKQKNSLGLVDFKLLMEKFTEKIISL